MNEAVTAIISANATDAPLLSINGLTVALRSAGTFRDVVRNLSFDIMARQTVAVVGESGSGKSITALSIMGLLPGLQPRCTGEIRFGGRSLLTCTPEEMRSIRGNDIAMIFQEPMTSLNPVLTVGFQIKEALKYHRGIEGAAADKRALELLERVRIPNAAERLKTYPHTLSGGMRQRAMIAMALASEPRLLIADEPTTALDVTVQQQILDLIKTLQNEMAMSVLFITHDMGVVADVADRVVVMRDGAKQEEGTTRDVFGAPRSAYAKQLLAAVPRLGSMSGARQPLKHDEVSIGGTPAATVDPGTVPLLSIRNLTTRFPVEKRFLGGASRVVHAVENVSFDLRKGETLALVGESGCGKSTTGRSLIRLVDPDTGSICFDGKEMNTASAQDLRRMRREIQMIFQDPYASLNPRKLIGKAIAEPMLVHGVETRTTVDARVADLLERVGLPPEAANRFPHEFSGGQRQRICIARALGLSPRIVIADEAVSALDVSIKSQVVDLMIDLQRELGLSYLFISHDIAVVERISHRVAVMYLGEIVEIGPRSAVIGSPHHEYTKRLMSAVPMPDPNARHRPIRLAHDEIPSLVREAGYVPAPTRMVEVGPAHYIRVNC